MANTRSAIKRMKQAEKRRLYNRDWRTRARSFVKKARTTLHQTDLAAATEATRLAVQDLDKAASRGVIHARNAARRKSRLMRQLHQLSTAKPAKPARAAKK
jgi:small subunit ribosomal protein S20